MDTKEVDMRLEIYDYLNSYLRGFGPDEGRKILKGISEIANRHNFDMKFVFDTQAEEKRKQKMIKDLEDHIAKKQAELAELKKRQNGQ